MKTSAGLLLYRIHQNEMQVFLVHPGGPFWKNKDLGAWSIPKGEFTDEDPLKAACREYEEETSFSIAGPFVALVPVKQSDKKTVYAWAVPADCNPSSVRSNNYQMEWPTGSGKLGSFPEVDRAGWFSIPMARIKILKGQDPLLDQLEELYKSDQLP